VTELDHEPRDRAGVLGADDEVDVLVVACQRGPASARADERNADSTGRSERDAPPLAGVDQAYRLLEGIREARARGARGPGGPGVARLRHRPTAPGSPRRGHLTRHRLVCEIDDH